MSRKREPVGFAGDDELGEAVSHGLAGRSEAARGEAEQVAGWMLDAVDPFDAAWKRFDQAVARSPPAPNLAE